MGEDKTVEILKSLADPTRLAIVRKLASCNTHQESCGKLSQKAELSQPAMSHHFSKLVDSGVVLEMKKGTKKSYRLNTALLDKIGINLNKI